MLQPETPRRLPQRRAIFERAGDGLDGLWNSGPATVAIPSDFRPHGCAPARLEGPMGGKLRRDPARSRPCWSRNFFGGALEFKRDRQPVALPFHNAVRESTPELRRRFRLV